MTWMYIGKCLNCGMPAEFVEPGRRSYSCRCGDVGVILDDEKSKRVIRNHLSAIWGAEVPIHEICAYLKNLKEVAIGKIRAAGSEAYSCPGSRPESPPGGRAPKGPSGGNIASTLGTVDAFDAMITGIEAIRERGKLSEERLRTIVSELITLIYKDDSNDR